MDRLPVKKVKTPRKQRVFHYFVLMDSDSILLRKRKDGDIWAGMYDFPSVDFFGEENKDNNAELPEGFQQLDFKEVTDPGDYTQTLTHQKIRARFFECEADSLNTVSSPDYHLVNRKNLDNFAFPKVIYCYLQDKSIL